MVLRAWGEKRETRGREERKGFRKIEDGVEGRNKRRKRG